MRVPRVPAVPAVPAAHIGDLHPFIQETLLVSSPPSSFARVNKVSKKFFDAERRYNYTTPKTFLELIKLYKNVLTKKRKATQVGEGEDACNNHVHNYCTVLLFKGNRYLKLYLPTVSRMVWIA